MQGRKPKQVVVVVLVVVVVVAVVVAVAVAVVVVVVVVVVVLVLVLLVVVVFVVVVFVFVVVVSKITDKSEIGRGCGIAVDSIHMVRSLHVFPSSIIPLVRPSICSSTQQTFPNSVCLSVCTSVHKFIRQPVPPSVRHTFIEGW